MSATDPRCYAHVFDPAHQGNTHQIAFDGWPAHVWSPGHAGRCQQCPEPVKGGDLYVCVAVGILHAACVAVVDASVLAGGAR